ncbi:MAG: hypothetical protein FJY85_10890 [Deltaproteobacteria bacterium]|nr:hypothetical protein [Deltaproteobacteria bacterium]
MTYEGNMGDEQEFDKKATETRMDIFLESLGTKGPRQSTSDSRGRRGSGPHPRRRIST